MMNWISDPGAGLAAALTLAVIFVWTGTTKVLDMDEFVGVVANFQILPQALVRPFALMTPGAEILAGLTVLLPWSRVAASILLLTLLVMFTLAIVVNLLRGRTFIDCGCFRLTARRPISWALVIRNLLLLALAGVVFLWDGARALTWLDFVTAVAAAMAGALMYGATPLLSSPVFDGFALDDAAVATEGEFGA